MDPGIFAAEKAAATDHIPYLDTASGHQVQARPCRVAVAARPDERHAEPVAAGPVVSQQAGSVVQVVHEQIQIAVVVVVAS